jgi:hypothetical protein
MSTRSLIAVEDADGTFRSIYVHWDGDSHLPILQKNYKTLAKVNRLIALGSLSILGSLIGVKTNFASYDPKTTDQCLAYGRDRGDIGTEARTSESRQCLTAYAASCWAEYLYIFSRNSEWSKVDIINFN